MRLCIETLSRLTLVPLPLCGLFAFAESAQEATSYEKLCTYDKLCSNLKNKDGSYVPPKPGLLQVMSALRNPLIDISKQMGVDPMAVTGSIVAENSMNVQVDDDTHSFMEKIKLNPLANDISKFIRGKSFSIGFGQIKPETALAVEPFLAKLESRSPRSQAETTAALVNPIENIKYAAAIVRSCQDSYQARGFDVSKDPAVLASLYNLGDCESRARQAQETKSAPRINYFGFFVNRFKEEIRKGAELDEPGGRLTSPLVGAVKVDRQLKSTVALLGSPPKCDTAGRGQMGDYKKLETLNISSLATQARGPYRVLAPGLDCDMNDWSLIRTDRGEVGWISNASLDKVSEPHVRTGGVGSCDTKIGEKCRDRLKGVLDKDFIGFDENGLMEVRLAGGERNPEKANFKAFDLSNCLESDSQSGSSRYGVDVIDSAEAAGFAKAFEMKKAEIVSSLKLKDFDDPRNPYRKVASKFAELVEECTPQCRVAANKFRQILYSKPSDFAGYQGYKSFTVQFDNLYLSKIENPGLKTNSTPVQANYSAWQGLLGEASAECGSLMSASSEARRRFSVLEGWVEKKKSSGDLKSPGFTSANPTRLPAICRGIKAAQKAHFKDPGASVSLTEKECGSCYIPVNFEGGSLNSRTSARLSELVNFATEDKDYDDLLSAAMAEPAQALGKAFDMGDQACTYNPIATAARIEALSSDPCVETVFAPDYYLVNKFKDRIGGAFYKPFSEDDRFAIKIKDGCGSPDSASTALKFGSTGAER